MDELSSYHRELTGLFLHIFALNPLIFRMDELSCQDNRRQHGHYARLREQDQPLLARRMDC
jgi:hypothetical protein